MRFGNWNVTTNGIENINNLNWFIARETMMSKRNLSGNIEIYDLLQHTTEKLSQMEDVMCLNLAFIYAINYYDINSFSEVIFNNTINAQMNFIND